VTYPLAPARMTAITSSAESDTLSAKHTGPGLMRASTAGPPPSGKCTSSSTTSGDSLSIPATAAPTVAASPTTCRPGSAASSARTPERKTA